MKNIEIKYRITEPQRLREFLISLPEVKFIYRHRQVDTYFRSETGRLKIREEEERPAFLIRYFRKDADTPRISDYSLTEISDLQQTLQTYTDRYGILARVEKWRELFMFRNVRIHLDEVSLLGGFLEFEAVISEEYDEPLSQQNLSQVMERMQPFLSQPVPDGYLELTLRRREIGNHNTPSNRRRP